MNQDTRTTKVQRPISNAVRCTACEQGKLRDGSLCPSCNGTSKRHGYSTK